MGQTSITSWLKQHDPSKHLRASVGTAGPSAALSGIEPAHSTRNEQSLTSADAEDASQVSTHSHANVSRASLYYERLPTNVQLAPISESSLGSFRRLVTLLLPIPYPDYFFRETTEDPIIASISRAAFWYTDDNDRPDADIKPQLVAAIRCRLLASPPGRPDDKTPVLYISTITTLAPFRGHSLATSLLEEVTTTAFHSYGISTVMAHVWEANEDAMGWYQKRGFAVVGRLEDYYRRLAPQTAALIVRRDFHPQDGPRA